MSTPFDRIHERDRQTDRRTITARRHRTPALDGINTARALPPASHCHYWARDSGLRAGQGRPARQTHNTCTTNDTMVIQQDRPMHVYTLPTDQMAGGQHCWTDSRLTNWSYAEQQRDRWTNYTQAQMRDGQMNRLLHLLVTRSSQQQQQQQPATSQYYQIHQRHLLCTRVTDLWAACLSVRLSCHTLLIRHNQ